MGCYSITGLPPALNLPVPINTTTWKEALGELSVLPKTGLAKSAIPLFWTSRFSFWASNFSFSLAQWVRDEEGKELGKSSANYITKRAN